MNDLEYTQLAALAAGLRCEIITRNSGGSSLRIVADYNEGAYWEPLLNNGQAQHLAVLLYISPVIGVDGVRVPGYPRIFVPHNGDRWAAARRAIVLAAAHDGEKLQARLTRRGEKTLT